MNKNKISGSVTVPKWWVEGLIQRADEFSEKIVSMEYHNEYQWAIERDELFRKASALLGYAVDCERYVNDQTSKKNSIQSESTIYKNSVCL